MTVIQSLDVARELVLQRLWAQEWSSIYDLLRAEKAGWKFWESQDKIYAQIL